MTLTYFDRQKPSCSVENNTSTFARSYFGFAGSRNERLDWLISMFQSDLDLVCVLGFLRIEIVSVFAYFCLH